MRPSELDRTDRIDAEFFQREFVNASAAIARIPNATITELAHISDGNHFTISEDFVEKGVPYYRGQDVAGHFFVEQSSPYSISEAAYSSPYMKRSHLRQGDVLLSIVGTIGKLGLVNDTRRATCSCKLAILRPKSIRPGYLAIFLSCRHGRLLVERWTRGAVQRGLLLDDMQEIRVPRFTTSFEDLIAQGVIAAQVGEHRATELFQSAGQLLSQRLGLEDGTQSDALTYRRTLKEVNALDRFDAEYYDPAVQATIAKLARQNTTIRDVADLRCELFSPKAGAPFHYIEISDVSQNGTVSGETLDGADAPSRAKWMVREKDVLTSTVRPIRRLSALIDAEQDGAVASSGFAVLQPRGIAPEVLLTYLRLPVICELMDLHTTASMYPAIAVKDILSLPFLRPSATVEQEIVHAVRWARRSRERATALLERAKHAVDLAIEESEEAALTYLREQS